MPPLVVIHGKAFRFHSPAEQVAMPALQRSAAGMIGERAGGHLVVGAGDLDGVAGFQFVEREIDGAAAIVARPVSGIGDEDFSFGWRGVPEKFGYVPGAIGVVDK